MQVGLRAGITGGYRVIFRYDKSPFCRTPDPTKQDKDQQRNFAATARHSPPIWPSASVCSTSPSRTFGCVSGSKGEASTNTKSLTAIGVGARIYTMSDSKFKIFVEPAVGMELEGGAGSPAWGFMDGTKPEYKTDFLFHLGVGPHYDFARAFGIYLNGGMTTGILRFIHTELEVTGRHASARAVSRMSDVARPFRILGLQQVAIGGLERAPLRHLWCDLLGLPQIGSYQSAAENVIEDILRLGPAAAPVELDLMQPLDAARTPRVHEPALNHIGLLGRRLAGRPTPGCRLRACASRRAAFARVLPGMTSASFIPSRARSCPSRGRAS